MLRFRRVRMPENQDGSFERAQLVSLRERIDREPVDVVSNRRRDLGGVVSVSIGLHDRHECAGAEADSESFEIAEQTFPV